MRLVEIEMTKEEYAALPHLSTVTKRDLEEVLPLGWRCKDKDGVVRELVRGLDMFADQWGAGLDVPARGWRYYTPKWANDDYADGSHIETKP